MLSPNIQKILGELNELAKDNLRSDDDSPRITVNKVTGRAGAIYEKLRYLIDYKEEHTIRRSAIERMLKRKLLFEQSENMGLSLLRELVSAGYLPNNKISETTARDIQKILDKYFILTKAIETDEERIVSLAASEIERFLHPQLLDDLVVDAFYDTVHDRIKYEGPPTRESIAIQTYLAVRISLLSDDYDSLFYALLIKYFPEFFTVQNEQEIKTIVPRFTEALAAARIELDSQLGWRIASRLKGYSVYFAVIRKIIKKHGAGAETIFSDRAQLEKEIETLLAYQYKKQHYLTGRSGTRAVFYIFFTKIVLAFLLELPYEKLVLGSLDYLALGTNIIFHPLLLLSIVKTIHVPWQDNTKKIISGVHAVVQNQEVKPIHIKPQIMNLALEIIFVLLYAVLFTISFGLILWVLNLLHFNIVSIILFLFFLTLVSYFGYRIRYRAKRWIVPAESEGLIDLLWSFFTIPIVRTGRWLMRKFSTINVFVFIMDFILETPFKLILGTFDSFISFLKEKKEDYN